MDGLEFGYQGLSARGTAYLLPHYTGHHYAVASEVKYEQGEKEARKAGLPSLCQGSRLPTEPAELQ